MKYPEEFSTEAQASVEAAKLRANAQFVEDRGMVDPYSPHAEPKIADLIRKYVIRIAQAFGKEACKLGLTGRWSAAEVDLKVNDFLLQVIAEAEEEKRFYSNGNHLRGFAMLTGYVQRSVIGSEMHRFKTSSEWME